MDEAPWCVWLIVLELIIRETRLIPVSRATKSFQEACVWVCGLRNMSSGFNERGGRKACKEEILETRKLNVKHTDG